MTVTRCVVLLLWLVVSGCGRGAGPVREETPAPARTEVAHTEAANVLEVDEGMLRDLRITTRTVESRTGGNLVVLLGELEVDQSAYAEVGAPVAARVERLLVNTGDTVRKGQVVAQLTSPALARERAEYMSASARLRLAEAALERKRTLAAERIAPLREVQEAEAEEAEARAALRAVRAQLTAFGVDAPVPGADETNAPTFVLRSPVSGAVIERSAVIGQMLEPATAAFRIGNLSTLWLTVHAFERDAVRLRPGIAARLAFPGLPGEDFSGRVVVVGHEVDRESRTVAVRIDVRNRGGVLKPGMSASATMAVGDSGDAILTVPVTSVQRVRNEWCVFLPQDERHFEVRRIGRGRDLGAEVEVLSGLLANERIVVDGAFLLKAQAERGNAGHDEH